MTDFLKAASWGMLVAPLLVFYFYFVDWTIKTGAIPPADSIQSAILVTMVLRLIIVMSFRRLRRAKVWVAVDIFALEVLIAAALLILFALTRAPVYLSTLDSLVPAWPTALALVLPAFALYRFGVAIVERARLSVVVPSAIGMFVLLLIPAQVAASYAGPQSLSSISRLILIVVLGLNGSQSLLPESTFAGILLFVALILYVVATGEIGESRAAALAVGIIGSLLVFGWATVGALMTNDLVLLFVIPGVVILGIIWGVTRGK